MISNEQWATDDSIETPKKVPQPVGYRILIRPKGSIEKTKGGIYLTDSNKEMQSLFKFCRKSNSFRTRML